ncbi:MAG: gamma-glutamyl-gamma-aminobutyrate hydrolase family protein [Rubricoccaceae bacterium]|nr:gamma-glutamyl-gamma-aminobutyrate hydrolase family protein [Rubricoccaceae bacterium]
MLTQRPQPDRPVIGVPTQTLQAIDGIPEWIPHSWVMNDRYFFALTHVGALPWMIPLFDDDEATLRGIYEHLDGLFIAGGVDVHPESYGEAVGPLCGRTDLARDRVELQLVRWSLEEGKPILGICRGMQIMNVARGGTLYQDCTEQHPGAIKHDYFPTDGYARDHLAHEVRVTPGTHLHACVGAATTPVNSMHHQGIKALGDGLTPSAYASDGLIEALEAPEGRFEVGVQWHPEMLIEQDPGMHRLFDSFIEAASAWRTRRRLVPLGA